MHKSFSLPKVGGLGGDIYSLTKEIRLLFFSSKKYLQRLDLWFIPPLPISGVDCMPSGIFLFFIAKLFKSLSWCVISVKLLKSYLRQQKNYVSIYS